MALPLEQFVKQLTDSGIIAPGKLENFVPPKASPQSTEDLLRALHKQNLLTKFQAQQAAAGKIRALILGEYTILDRIGAGGMGQVFKAEHRRMKRAVAIKTLPASTMKDAAAIARFEREVEAAAKLRHPNIVAADDAGHANGQHFLVMEYVEGQDLSALVKKNGPFSVAKAVDYIVQAARGLEFAHGEGVIHRDIKPANLLLDKRGTIKILDMGLARIEASGISPTQAELTGTGAVMGTVDYMAPEQAVNTKNADARADIYSLGVTLWYLVSGCPMYGGDTVVEKLLAHQMQPIPSLAEKCADAPPGFDEIFARMVAKAPADRYQSMTEVIADLQALATGSPSGTSHATSASSSSTSNSNLTFLDDATIQTSTRRTSTTPNKPKKPAATSRSGTNKKKLAVIGGCVAAALVALVGFWFLVDGKGKPEVANTASPSGKGTTSSQSPDETPLFPGIVAPGGSASVTTDPASSPSTIATAPAASAVAGDMALKFDGRTSEVIIPGLQRDGGPFTIECRIKDFGTIVMPILRVNGRAPIQLHIANRAPHGAERDADDKLGRDLSKEPVQDLAEWTHLAYVVDSAKASLYVNGKLARQVNGAPVTGGVAAKFSDTWIGMETPAGMTARYQGLIDEIRVTSGVRYSGPFVPEPRFEADDSTLALYHCDEGSGSQLIDASRHGRHGKITSVAWVPANHATPSLSGGWKELFNGRDLSGWTGKGHQGWRVAGGALVGETDGPPGWLASDADYGDFELEFEYKLAKDSNSGVFLRAEPEGKPLNGAEFHEVQIIDDAGPKFAAVSADSRTGALFHKIAPQNVPPLPAGQWHRMRISCYSDQLRVSVNQASIVDGALPPGKAARGRIGLQIYPTHVEFRKIHIRELRPDGSPLAAAPAAYAGPAVDLMPLVRIDRPTRSSAWQRNAQGIVIPGDGSARTQIDFAVPAEYELQVDAVPLSGAKSLILGLPRAGQRFWIPVSGWNNAVTKLEPTPTTGAGQADSTALRLEDNRPVKLICTVRRDGVKLVGDGKTLIDWSGDTTSLTPEWASWVLPEPEKLALGSWEGVIRVTRLELRPLVPSPPQSATP